MTPEEERAALEEVAAGAICLAEHLASKGALQKVCDQLYAIDPLAETFFSRLLCAVIPIRELKAAPPWFRAASIRLSHRYHAAEKEAEREQN